jgi:hypothetical protein
MRCFDNLGVPTGRPRWQARRTSVAATLRQDRTGQNMNPAGIGYRKVGGGGHGLHAHSTNRHVDHNRRRPNRCHHRGRRAVRWWRYRWRRHRLLTAAVDWPGLMKLGVFGGISTGSRSWSRDFASSFISPSEIGHVQRHDRCSSRRGGQAVPDRPSTRRVPGETAHVWRAVNIG